jgi:hypothetical protein
MWTNIMRYYFDLRDGDDLAPDEEGIELRSPGASAARGGQDFGGHGTGCGPGTSAP